MDTDQLYDEVSEAAYWSLRRHNSGARTQMLTRADTIEWHVMRETQARMQPEIDRLLAENEALREAGREVLDAMSQIMIRGVHIENLDSRMRAATNMLKTVLATHDRGEK